MSGNSLPFWFYLVFMAKEQGKERQGGKNSEIYESKLQECYKRCDVV